MQLQTVIKGEKSLHSLELMQLQTVIKGEKSLHSLELEKNANA
jgi:hypothetical protein